MTEPEHETGWMKGSILFGALILIITASSLAAYMSSGHMGIEERFSSAVGIQGGSDEKEGETSGVFGFGIEGNPSSYAVILAALVVLSIIVYFKGRSV
jgi:hypothetical protein